MDGEIVEFKNLRIEEFRDLAIGGLEPINDKLNRQNLFNS